MSTEKPDNPDAQIVALDDARQVRSSAASLLDEAGRIATPTGWMAHYTFVLPPPAEVHPTMANCIESELKGLVPVLAVGKHSIAVTCAIDLECPPIASLLADHLGQRLLNLLGLPASSLSEPVLDRYRPLDSYLRDDATVIPFDDSNGQ